MNQMAVEWLEKQIGSKIADANIKISLPTFYELINKAKEIEYKNITNAYVCGKVNSFNVLNVGVINITAEEYYNKNFKKK